MNAMTKLALVVGGAFALYKFSGNSMVKTAAVAVGAIALAKQVPVVNETI